MARTYEPIASQTLGSAASTVEFTSIPGTYTDLVLVTSARTVIAGFNGYEDLYLRLNGDSGSNYSLTEISGNGSAAASGRLSSQTLMYHSLIPGSGAAAGNFAISVAHLMSYANTNVFKTMLVADAYAPNRLARKVALWRSTAAVTSILVATTGSGGQFATGSTFSLYGIKAA